MHELIQDIYRIRRELLGISQKFIAEKVGLSNLQISRWENGEAKLDDEQIDRIGAALDMEGAKQQESSFPGIRIDAFPDKISGPDCKMHREVFGISQEALALRAGLPRCDISFFENGQELSPYKIERLTNAVKFFLSERLAELRMLQALEAKLREEVVKLKEQNANRHKAEAEKNAAMQKLSKEDLLIEDVTASYEREKAELVARLNSKDKDVQNLRECLVLMNKILDEATAKKRDGD